MSLAGSSTERDALTITWEPSPDSAGDLAGYNLYFNDAATPTTLTTADTSFAVSGLSAATGYPIRVTSFDGDGNESAGASITVAPSWLKSLSSQAAKSSLSSTGSRATK